MNEIFSYLVSWFIWNYAQKVIWDYRTDIISKIFDYSKSKIWLYVFMPITLPIAMYFLVKLAMSEDFNNYTKS